MIINDIKFSFRGLKKNKVYSFLSILGFSIGFSICLIVGLYAYNELTVDKCYPNYGHIYRILDTSKNGNGSVRLDYDDLNIFRDNYPEIEKICPLNTSANWERPFQVAGKPFWLKGFITTSNDFFDIFNIRILKSMGENPFSEKNSIVLTKSTSIDLYGDNNPLGQEIILDNDKMLMVTAIIEDFPENSSLQANVLFNCENEKIRASHSGDGHGGWYYSVNQYILLKNGSSKIALEEKINQTIAHYNARAENIRLQPLQDIYLASQVEGNNNQSGSKFMLVVFIIIATLILLLSLINQVNFTLALQYSKLKEIGIKKTIGANIYQLMKYFLTERFVWLFMALLLSLPLVKLGLLFSRALFNKQLAFETLFSFPFLGFVFLIMAVLIIISSLVPLFVLSRFDIRMFMAGKIIKSGKKRGEKVLTTFQLAVSIIMIVSVIVIYRQVDFIKSRDLGFNKENLLQLKLPANYTKAEVLKERLGDFPFILSSSVSSGTPGMINNGGYTGPREKEFPLNRMSVDADFFKTFDIEIKGGHNFFESENDKVCLVNETMLDKLLDAYGWKSFEGNTIEDYEIVGVAKDFHVASMHNPLEPLLLMKYTNRPTAISLRIQSKNLRETMDKIKGVWEEISPETPFAYQFYDEWFDAMYSGDERLSESISLFSIIALVITCMGLLGQMFQLSINKTKEIGVRKVNGARVSEILTLLNKDFVKRVIIAFVIATPIAWFAMTTWLDNFAYKTEISWWIFVVAGLTALGIALLTISWQSWRAATKNPVEALRYE